VESFGTKSGAPRFLLTEACVIRLLPVATNTLRAALSDKYTEKSHGIIKNPNPSKFKKRKIAYIKT
jgi:hypothetical protein